MCYDDDGKINIHVNFKKKNVNVCDCSASDVRFTMLYSADVCKAQCSIAAEQN